VYKSLPFVQDFTLNGLLEQPDVDEWVSRGSRAPPGFRNQLNRKFRKSSQLSTLVLEFLGPIWG
jgi:hypothetical protein